MDYQLSEKEYSNNKGKVTCNKNILLSIINLATKEIAGVSSLCDNFGSGIKKVFSNNYTNGVKIEYVNDGIDIDVFINILYGYSVPDIAYKVQENIKNGISAMLDVKINSINVHVQNVDFSEKVD
jgi:uncharacterized alkaline shock family protein YloU